MEVREDLDLDLNGDGNSLPSLQAVFLLGIC
jgi:hypothetical protein